MEHLGGELAAVIRKARQGQITFREWARESARRFIVDALQEHNFNQCRAARALGFHRNTLARHIAELGIDLDALSGKSRYQRFPPARVPHLAAKQAAMRARWA